LASVKRVDIRTAPYVYRNRLSPESGILPRWIDADRTASRNFIAPHAIAVDLHGDIYVGEVTHTFGVTPGLVPMNARTFQKFERRSA
jgi:hypothetical protein